MKVIIKQENEDIALLIHGLMKANKTNLSKICRENELDYTKTYRAIHNDFIKMDFLEEIVELIGDGAQIRSEFFLSLEDKNGELIQSQTIGRNGGKYESPDQIELLDIAPGLLNKK